MKGKVVMKKTLILKLVLILNVLISCWYIYDCSLWNFRTYTEYELVRLYVNSSLFGFVPILYGIICILEKSNKKVIIDNKEM